MENLALEAVLTIILNISILSIALCLIYQAFNKMCILSKPLKTKQEKQEKQAVSRDLSELATAHAWGQSVAEDRKRLYGCTKKSSYVSKVLATKRR